MTVQILTGDCRAVLATLPAESVHCVVTSPPYWGLRDYGTATWEGGVASCEHIERQSGRGSSTLTSAGIGQTDEGSAYLAQKRQFRILCGHCGARRIDSQLGLEPDFNDYIAVMVDVFREVRRVLRKDGTLWLNLGDSYATSVNGRSAAGTKAVGNDDRTFRDKPFSTVQGVLKPKDICGIPWRVAFALQSDGWRLRQDIIWSKSNPMPESVRDRCTKAHEYLFLLAKSERYYYDQDAIAEVAIPGQHTTTAKSFGTQAAGAVVKPSGNQIPGSTFSWGGTRNKRSVWEIATSPYSEAHFATFPPALVEPCILAGCTKGGTVLDPFGGAGTTGLVADRLQRNAILVELSPAYAEMARRRIEGDAPLFATVTDGYNAEADMRGSIAVCYAAVKARVAAGGKGWHEYPMARKK